MFGGLPTLLACVQHCCEVRFFSCDLAVQADVAMGGYERIRLLNTSDAADDTKGVNLGGCRTTKNIHEIRTGGEDNW